MTKPMLYILVGTPGSGKTWVMDRLGDKYHTIHHDDPANGGLKGESGYIETIVKAVKTSDKTVVAEKPFSLSKLKDPLEALGIKVKPIFILETPETTTKRYEDREGKSIPKGHLTRIDTYRQRAKDLKAFSGTSEEVLDFLKLRHVPK